MSNPFTQVYDDLRSPYLHEKKAKKDGVGFTLKYIADNFNAMGLHTRTGKAWSTRSVQLLKKQQEAISLKTI